MSLEVLTDYYEGNFNHLVNSLARSPQITFEDAEDIVQDSFEKGIKYINSYNSSRPFEGWFRGILQNSRSDKLSDINHKGMSLEFEEEEDGELFEKTLSKQIHEDIASKPDPIKKVLVYYYYHGLNSVEIGRMVGRAQSTIRTIIGKFKKEIGSYDIRHGGQRP
jgi:RNA polymerase sigma factor (sigma-70 family)